MELLKQYSAIEEQVHAYFGYKEDWRVIPLDDQTGKHWMLFQDESGKGSVVWSDTPFTLHQLRPFVMPDKGSNEEKEPRAAFYSGTIYTQRFLPKWVYEGKEYTMVCVDTHCDMNVFLMIFTNNLHCTDKELRKAYLDNWNSF